MARNGYRILDSDMHVFEPNDLYLKYIDPRWEDRIPRGEPRKKTRPDQIFPCQRRAASAFGSSSTFDDFTQA